MFSDKIFIVHVYALEISCLCPYKESEISKNYTSYFRLPQSLQSAQYMRMSDQAGHSNCFICTCNHEVVIFYDTPSLVFLLLFLKHFLLCLLTNRLLTLTPSGLCLIVYVDFFKRKHLSIQTYTKLGNKFHAFICSVFF